MQRKTGDALWNLVSTSLTPSMFRARPIDNKKDNSKLIGNNITKDKVVEGKDFKNQPPPNSLPGTNSESNSINSLNNLSKISTVLTDIPANCSVVTQAKDLDNQQPPNTLPCTDYDSNIVFNSQNSLNTNLKITDTPTECSLKLCSDCQSLLEELDLYDSDRLKSL